MSVTVKHGIDQIYHLVQYLFHNRLTKFILLQRLKTVFKLASQLLLRRKAIGVIHINICTCLAVHTSLLKIRQQPAHESRRLIGKAVFGKVNGIQPLHYLIVIYAKLLGKCRTQLLLVVDRIYRMPQFIQRLLHEVIARLEYYLAGFLIDIAGIDIMDFKPQQVFSTAIIAERFLQPAVSSIAFKPFPYRLAGREAMFFTQSEYFQQLGHGQLFMSVHKRHDIAFFVNRQFIASFSLGIKQRTGRCITTTFQNDIIDRLPYGT